MQTVICKAAKQACSTYCTQLLSVAVQSLEKASLPSQQQQRRPCLGVDRPFACIEFLIFLHAIVPAGCLLKKGVQRQHARPTRGPSAGVAVSGKMYDALEAYNIEGPQKEL